MGAIDWNAVGGNAAPASAPQGAINWDAVHAPAAAPAALSPLHAAIVARVANDPISQGAQAGPSFWSELVPQMGNLAAGAVRGAGSIGSTILAAAGKLHDTTATPAQRSLEQNGANMDADGPVSDGRPTLTSLVTGQVPLSQDAQRRQDMDSALRSLGADTSSPAYGAGKLMSEVAGTAGIGGAITGALRAAPAVANAGPAASALVDSIGSGGFSVGQGTGSAIANMLMRAGGGAVNGGASAALVDPSTAQQGAELGAALPVGAQAVGKALSLTGSGISGLITHGLGATTGAGSDAISNAFQAGRNGSDAFIDNLRGNVPFSDVVDQARQGIGNLRAARSAEYKAGMSAIGADKTVLDFQPVSDAIKNVNSTGFYKGQQINGSAADTLGQITDKVNQWQALDPKEFHTAEGFDALKQSVGDIRDATQFGTPARRAADSAYNAIKGQIVKQAPDYAKTMQGYGEASDQINEITKGLSLGDKASADTSIRKLQSVMRNNAQTSYGNRISLAQALQEHGNVDLMPALAGQAMNSWTPRGMVGALEKSGGVLAALTHPAMLAAAPLTSPRLVGEAAYGAGRLFGKTPDAQAVGSALMQGAGSNPQTLLTSKPNSAALARALANLGVLAPSAVQ